jgi:serine/threonine protein kinase
MPSESPLSQPVKKNIRLGKYEVWYHIATGGMGAVYHALDTEQNREVALKILPPDLASKPAMVVRFRREYAAASKMRHENIVELYELGELNQTLYFAMEFVEGIDLHEYVKKEGPLDPEEARQIILQGARALRHAAQHGIVHRDIKPSNFLLSRKNGKVHVKLTDFGLAREVTDDQYRVTRAGTTVGTIDYMSPEQARDSGNADARSDLYSLGSTWFHLLTGQAPFPAGGLGERLIRIMNDAPPDICKLNPRVSPACREILEKLLAKSPDDRYPTAEALIDDLLSLEGQTTRKPRSSETRKKRSKRAGSAEPSPRSKPTRAFPMGAVAGAVLAVVLVVGGGLLLWQREPKRDEVTESPPPPIVPPPVVILPELPITNPNPEQPARPKQDQDPVRSKGLPSLGNAVLDPNQLRTQAERSWVGGKPVEAPIRKVRRVTTEAGTFRSLEEALAAPGPAVIELHDQGPFYETSLNMANREILLRAAPGYRPMIVWDIPALLEKRRGEKASDLPLCLVHGNGGRLHLEGIEVVWRVPETLGESLTLFQYTGEVRCRDCVFTALGKPREHMLWMQMRGDQPGARLRLDRCHIRGTDLALVECSAPAAEVMIDGCLITTTGPAMLRIRNDEQAPTQIQVVRSTLASSSRWLEFAPLKETDRKPALHLFLWDSVLASLAGRGEMITLDTPDTVLAGVRVRPNNVLYAGWPALLRHGETVRTTLAQWREQWVSDDCEGVCRETWPEAGLDEMGLRPVSAFAPLPEHRFASSVHPELPVGCDAAVLPVGRVQAHFPLGTEAFPVAGLEEPPVPEIATPLGSEFFHGARLDLDGIPDLGAYLDALRRTRKFAQRVVLHLAGKGEKTTSPIRLTGCTLVLYFEEPAEKDSPRLSLKGNNAAEIALIDIQKGGLEITNGVIRLPDLSRLDYGYVVRVEGGDVRLHHTRIEGPTQSTPDNYRGAMLVRGSGGGGEATQRCELSDCVLLSGQRGLCLGGNGLHVRVQNSLIVANETLVLSPEMVRGELNTQAYLQRVTLGFRRAAVVLAVPGRELLREPVILRTRDCALMCPFQLKPTRTALLLEENEALTRGALHWISERDALDPRWHVAAWPTGPIPETRAPRTDWNRLLGSYGVRAPRSELPALRGIDGKPWALDRLHLPGRDAPGANLVRLGLRKP